MKIMNGKDTVTVTSFPPCTGNPYLFLRFAWCYGACRCATDQHCNRHGKALQSSEVQRTQDKHVIDACKNATHIRTGLTRLATFSLI